MADTPKAGAAETETSVTVMDIDGFKTADVSVTIIDGTTTIIKTADLAPGVVTLGYEKKHRVALAKIQ
jgi:hypothetical protein